MKACNKCGEIKPLTEFHKQAKSADGHTGHCKLCQRAVHKAWCEANPERQAANLKAWREANPERYAASLSIRQARSKGRWPEKVAARLEVRNAIAAGTLVKQPCEVCGEIKVHGHHDDYSKPLEVRWLCPKHHTEHHTEHTRNLNREKVA